MMKKGRSSSFDLEVSSLVECESGICCNSTSEISKQKAYPCAIFYNIQAPKMKFDNESSINQCIKRSSLTPCVSQRDYRASNVTKNDTNEKFKNKFENLSITGNTVNLLTRPGKLSYNETVPSNVCIKRCLVCNDMFEFPHHKVCIICQEEFLNLDISSFENQKFEFVQSNLFKSSKVSNTASIQLKKNEFESAVLNRNSTCHSDISLNSKYCKKCNKQSELPSLNNSLCVTPSGDELSAFKEMLHSIMNKKPKVSDESLPKANDRNAGSCASSLNDDTAWDNHVLNFSYKDTTEAERNAKNYNKNDTKYERINSDLKFCKLCFSIISDFDFKFCKLCHQVLAKSDYENLSTFPDFAKDEIFETATQDCKTCFSQFNYKFCDMCHKLMPWSEFSDDTSDASELSNSKSSVIADNTDFRFIVNDTKSVLQDTTTGAILNEFKRSHQKTCNAHLLDLCRICGRESSECLCSLEHTVCQPFYCFFETYSKVQEEMKSISDLLNCTGVLDRSTLSRKKEIPHRKRCFYGKSKFKSNDAETSSKGNQNKKVTYLHQFLENSHSPKFNFASDAKRLLLQKSEAILHEMWHLQNETVDPEKLLAVELKQNVNLMKAVQQLASKRANIPRHVMMYQNLPPA